VAGGAVQCDKSGESAEGGMYKSGNTKRSDIALAQAQLCHSFIGIGNGFEVYSGITWSQQQQDG